jgi:pimeloyl-ACP methyl ester carboxylesterase
VTRADVIDFLSLATETARQLVRPDGCVVNFWITPIERRERAAVLLHGLASNHSRFDEFAHATTLIDSWCLVQPDLRGQGLSRWRGPISARIAADDIAALLDQLRYRRAALIGHSLGANVALEFARAWPDRTEALVLIEPNFGEALEGGMRRARRATPLLQLAIVGAGVANRFGLFRRSFPYLDLQALDRETRAHLRAGKHEALTGRYASPRRDLRYLPTSSYLQWLIESTRPAGDLAKIPAPTLVLLSRGAVFGDPVVTRRVLARLPRADVKTLESRHWIPTENPAEMREAIEGFLRGLEDTGN